MKKTKFALFQSIVALILCLSMFVSTTFALFTDSITSHNNIITTGKLDVSMYWADEYRLNTAAGGTEATDITEWNDASAGTVFNYEYWEPGFTDTKYIKISNEGNLALTYRLYIVPDAPAAEGEADLADVIDVYILPAEEAMNLSREQIAALTPAGSLSALMTSSTGATRGVLLPVKGAEDVALSEKDQQIAVVGEDAYCIILKMRETTGNEYQNQSAANGFSVQLVATQYTWENDSFGNGYDVEAASMLSSSNGGDITNPAEPFDIVVGNLLKVTVPANALQNPGKVGVKISETDVPNDFVVQADKLATAYEISIEGAPNDGSVIYSVELFAGKNLDTVDVYHKGILIPDTHYDPVTGIVSFKTGSFSPFVVVYDKPVYTVSWDTDGDGNVDDTTEVAFGVVPTHAPGSKPSTTEQSYTFVYWTPQPKPVTGDITYTATFSEDARTYTIVWKDGDKIVDEQQLSYNAIPVYQGETLTKQCHTLSWSSEIVPVIGDATYTAVWTAEHAWSDATCTAPKTCSVCGTEVGVATGHTYGNAVVTWDDGYETAKVTVICSVCTDTAEGHTKETTVTAEKTTVTATCQTKGSVTYKVEGSFEGKAYKDTKFVEGDYAAHILNLTEKQNSTCAAVGHEAYWQCQTCNKYFSDAEGKTEITDLTTWLNDAGKIGKLSPVYGDAKVNWVADFETAKVTVTCSVCNGTAEGHTKETTVTAEKTTVPATCQTKGSVTYKVEGTFEGKSYEETKTVEGDFGAHVLKSFDMKDSTCAEVGHEAYWQCQTCNTYFSDGAGKDVIAGLDGWLEGDGLIIKKSHTYGDVNVVFTKDGLKATVSVTCSVCAEGAEGHTLTETVNTTAVGSTTGTCLEVGTTTYKVKGEIGGKTYEKDITIDGAKGAHAPQMFDAKAATCVEAGHEAYWQCQTCNKYFSDADAQNEIENLTQWLDGDGKIDKLDPVYGDAKVDWAADFETAKVTVTCSVCNGTAEGHTKETTVTAEKTTVPATCQTKGSVTYKVEGTFEGKAYKDTKFAEGNFGAHDLKLTEKKDSTCSETGTKAYWSCQTANCGKHFSDADAQNAIENLTQWLNGEGKIAQKAHTYGAPVVTWGEGYETAKVTVTCSVCNGAAEGHSKETTVTAEKTTVPATCQTKGSVTYKVEGTIEGKSFEATKTVDGEFGTHALQLVEEQDSTCAETGHEAYWSCQIENCGKHFFDAEGKTEIADLTAWLNGDGLIAKKAHTDEIADNRCDVCDGVVYNITFHVGVNTTRVDTLSLGDEINYHEDEMNEKYTGWIGWSDTENGNVVEALPKTMPAENLTFYAVFKTQELTDKFDTVLPADFIYRVGNQNTVALSSLFKAIDGAEIGNDVDVTVAAEKGSVTGTYTKNDTDWAKGTIKFEGTGFVNVTIQEEEISNPYTLKLEVVDAVNATSATSAKANNVVLLQDVALSTIEVSGGHTLYGNGFKMTATSDPMYDTLQAGFVTLNNGTLDNVQVICPNFSYSIIYNNQIRNSENTAKPSDSSNDARGNVRSAVMATGNSKIVNSKVHGGRAAIFLRSGNLVINGSTISGGAAANIHALSAQSLTLRNVTLVQKPYTDNVHGTGKTIMGFSGLFECGEDGNSTPLILEGTLVQNAWVNKDYIKYTPSAASSIVESALSKTAYLHDRDGIGENESLNLGFTYIPQNTGGSTTANVTDNRTNKDTIPYDVVEVGNTLAKAKVYSYKNTNGTAADFSVDEEYAPNAQGATPPTVSFTDTNADRVFETKFDTNDGRLESTLTVDLVEKYDFSFDKLLVQKHGETLTYTVKAADGRDVDSSKTIELTASGVAEYVLTVTDGEATHIIYFTLTATKISIPEPEVVDTTGGTALLVVKSKDGDWSCALPALEGIKVKYYTADGEVILDLATLTPTSTGKQNGTNNYWEINKDGYKLKVTCGVIHDTKSVYGMPVVVNNSGNKLYFTISSTNGYVSTSTAARSVKLTYEFTDLNGKTLTFSKTWNVNRSDMISGGAKQYSYSDFVNGTLKEASGGSSCVTPDTLITLADGKQVRVDSLTGNEQLLVWNHQTGKYDTAPVAYIVNHNEEVKNHEITHLFFSDGSEVKVINEHVFYDVSLNKYIALTGENFADYLGHEFAAYEEGNGNLKNVKLEKVEQYMEETSAYEVVSYKHLTCFTNDILSTSAYLDKLLNVFDIDSVTMAYNADKVAEDIATYGLYTYEDFRDLITEEAFELYNAAYLKVAIGKGYITWDDILNLIDIYFDVDVNPIQ